MKKYKKICIVLFILILISIPLSTFLGSANITFSQVIDVYKYHLPFANASLEDMGLNSIIWNIRLPRTIVAVIVGSGLAMTGCIMQALTGNIMAEPYTLGIQSGAGMFAAFSIAFFDSVSPMGIIGTNTMAFLGAMLVMLSVYTISSRSKSFSRSNLILVGISISMLCSAITQLIIAFAPDNSKVRGIVFWMMGGLGGIHWEDIPFSLIVCLTGFAISFFLSEQLNIISMGKETAVILGVKINRLNKILLLLVSIIVGALVSISGSVGFVGLIIPHLARRFIGANHKELIPVSTLLGGLFLVWADTTSRIIVAPKDLPIGVLTSLIGVPFFLFIMKKRGQVM